MNPSDPGPPRPREHASLFFRYWVPVIAYVILIFGASSVPGRDVPTLFPHADKLEHLAEYALFGLLLGRAFRFTIGGRRGMLWALAAVAAGGLVGGMDELYQRLTPGRVSDVRDWIVDVAAGFLAGLFPQDTQVPPRPPPRGPPPGAAPR